MKTVQLLSVILVAPVMLGGCMVKTSLRITNRTGQEIAVRSEHTGKVTRIADNRAAVVPHTVGPVDVSTLNGPLWHYPNIDVPSYKSYLRRMGLFIRQLRLYLALEKDGTLYVLSPAQTRAVDHLPKQPAGFPFRPESSHP
jgi:hypothetical protein